MTWNTNLRRNLAFIFAYMVRLLGRDPICHDSVPNESEIESLNKKTLVS